MVTASARGMVSQIPETPMIRGRIRMKAVTKISDLREEISAETRPFPSAVKQPERNTFQPIKRNTGQNSFSPM